MGKTFGRLTVIKKGKKDKAQHQYWICECECGNIVEVNSDNLRRGLTKSCGCLHSETTHNLLFKNITGQKYGKLTVLDYEMENNIAYWTCLCDCGNKVKIKGSNLKNGHTQSCGCIAYSIGEKNISDILKNNNIYFIKEYTFSDFPKRRYDFYLPDYNRLIEFDGIQHTGKKIGGWYTEEEVIKLQQRDNEKNEYAKSHNIELVRIPHTERDNMTLEMLLGDKYLVK